MLIIRTTKKICQLWRMNYGIYINFKLYSSTQQILKQHIILVELLHNSTLVMKMFIQSGQYPNINTVNYETKGWIHPQIMWDCSRADHYRSSTSKKRDCILDWVTVKQYTWCITQPKLSWTSTQKLLSYLSARAALFTHKPKGKNISKDYCFKADLTLVFPLCLPRTLGHPYVQEVSSSKLSFFVLCVWPSLLQTCDRTWFPGLPFGQVWGSAAWYSSSTSMQPLVLSPKHLHHDAFF